MDNPIDNSNKSSFFQRNNLTLKGLIILILTFILLIPAGMISSLIYERQTYRDNAIAEVSEKWAHAQTLTGPMLILPYRVTLYDEKGAITGRSVQNLQILPEELTTEGEVFPTIKHRGIYDVVLYRSDLTMTGIFKLPNLEAHIPTTAEILWEKAFIALGVSDMRGLEAQPALMWNGKSATFEPGFSSDATPEMTGVSAFVAIPQGDVSIPISVKLKMKGSGSLFFTPVGRTNGISLRSSWSNPKFTGTFLPDSSNITKEGFYAHWKVLHMNRNYPQVSTSDLAPQIGVSAFGLEFFRPVDHYSKSLRSVKYAIMFIGLTFLLVFFMEMRQKSRVHPFQYALIGVALVIFYTLLVSISEHLNFDIAYLISAVMTSGLVSLFATSLFGTRQSGILTGGVLTLLYGFLYVTLRSEDYALLIGSVGLFIILALVMYYSRRISLFEQ